MTKKRGYPPHLQKADAQKFDLSASRFSNGAMPESLNRHKMARETASNAPVFMPSLIQWIKERRDACRQLMEAQIDRIGRRVSPDVPLSVVGSDDGSTRRNWQLRAQMERREQSWKDNDERSAGMILGLEMIMARLRIHSVTIAKHSKRLRRLVEDAAEEEDASRKMSNGIEAIVAMAVTQASQLLSAERIRDRHELDAHNKLLKQILPEEEWDETASLFFVRRNLGRARTRLK